MGGNLWGDCPAVTSRERGDWEWFRLSQEMEPYEDILFSVQTSYQETRVYDKGVAGSRRYVLQSLNMRICFR